MSNPLDLTQDEQSLLTIVPKDGSTIGNQRARESLSWDEERYFAVRDALSDRGVLVRGVGRGGTIRRVLEPLATETVTVAVGTEESPSEVGVDVLSAVRREEELYEPMASVLRGTWAKDRRIQPLGVEVAARQGRRATGGTWSRPDIVSAEVRTFEYVPGKVLEVVTFEVKPADAIDVQAVYEALAHRRASTRAYVLLHVPIGEEASLESVVKDVRLVARSHGIGVLIAGDPGDYGTWEELEEAHRVEPDPERLNQFIETQLSDRLRKAIARTLR